MSKLHIKKDDTVIVIAGADKGKTGKVLKVLVEENRAIVEGVHMVSKSTKPSAKNPQGGIVKQYTSVVIETDVRTICTTNFLLCANNQSL